MRERDYKGRSLLDFPNSYVVIDVETTGLDPTYDKIIEIGALKVENGTLVDSFSTLVNPGVPVDDFITQLTGITNDDLASAPAPDSALSAFSSFIGDSILVGHNVHFDVNFLYDAFEYTLDRYLENNFIDTLRWSKRLIKNAPSYKLSALADFLDISVDTAHRALADCETTNLLYLKLRERSNCMSSDEEALLTSLSIDNTNPFFGKNIVVKGLPQLYSYAFMQSVAAKCGASMGDTFYKTSDYIIFSKYTYNRFLRDEPSRKIKKAKQLSEAGSLTILSEEAWCRMLNIPVPVTSSSSSSHHHHAKLSAKDISTSNTEFDESHPLYGKLCVFTGALQKMQRKDAMQIVVDLGGQVGNSVTKKTNYLILGNNDYCPFIKDGKSSKQKKAEALKLAGNDIEIISENVFYDMISED